MQTVRPVNSTDQGPHVCGRAWTGDENKISNETLAAEYVWAKQIAWLRHDRLSRHYCDMQRRKQTCHAGFLKTDINTDRASASYSGKGLGNPDWGTDHFVRVWIGAHSRISREFGE